MKIIQFTFAFLVGLLMAFTATGQEAQLQTLAQVKQETAPKTQLAAKKDGVIRIGVVTVGTVMRQDAGGHDISEVIRTRWYSFLSGPTIELVPIEARLTSQANIEAGQKQCDYVLYSTISQKTKGSLFSGFLKVAVPVVASAVPVGVGSTATVTQSVGQSVQDGAKNAAKNLASESAAKIKAHDEVTLDFDLVKVDGVRSPAPRSLKARAKADGEDIFSPLIEQAAEQIVQSMVKG